MSHYAHFSFTALAAAEIPQQFDNAELAEFSTELPFNGQSAEIRRIFGQTRSDWLKWVSRDLLAKTPYNSLQFLAADYLVLPTEQTAYNEKFEEDEFQTDFYTVIAPSQLDKVLNELTDFLTWCSTHIVEVSDVMEWGHEDIKTALERAEFQNYLNDCYWGEDGDTPDFFFCTLKSMQVILQYAKTHGLYAIYENENSTGLNIPAVTLLD